MTPQQFHDAYLATANRVSAGTGIDPLVLLAQWANETDWGRVVIGYNLGNIRDAPRSFARYGSLDEFANAAIRVFLFARPNPYQPVSTSNNYYWGVMAATTPWDQLAAIVASPWSSGHYGGSLDAFYTALGGLTLAQYDVIKADLDQILGIIQDPNSGLKALASAIKAIPGGSPGTTPEPPEPAEPKTINLTITGTATGSLT